LPPGRFELKYSVPSAVTDGEVSWLLVFTGASRCRGALQPVPDFSTTHRSLSAFGVAPSTGRREAKNSFVPSGEKQGSLSLYSPENGATSGVVHFPFSKCDITITRKLRSGVDFTK